MTTDPKERAFEYCLEKMLEGAELEEVLNFYPEWAEELRPMLEVAQAARRVGSTIHVPKAARARSRAKLLAEARRLSIPQPRFSFARMRFGLAALILVLALIFLGGTTFVVSAQSLPGEPLYSVKIFAEQTRLRIAKNPAQKLELEQSFDQERVAEVDALIKRSRSMIVQFAGGLSQMDANEWMVGNIRVLVSQNTQIQGEIQPDFYIGVQGLLQADGTVLAQKIWDREYQFSGRLQKMTSGQWVVGSVVLGVTPDTIVQGSPQLGSLVSVQAVLLTNGDLQAHLIRETGSPLNMPVFAPNGTSTPSPSSTEVQASSTPQPPQFIEPQKSPEPTEKEVELNTPEPTHSFKSTNSPEPTEDEREHDSKSTEQLNPTESPKPTSSEDEEHKGSDPTRTPKPTRTPTPGGSYQPSQTPQPGASPTSTQDGEHEDSPSPTPTPKPTKSHDD
jgi:hypothetical protein